MDPLEELRLIREEGEALAVRRRDVMLRAYDQRRTVTEIGEALGIRHQTVSEQLRRFRRERDEQQGPASAGP